ncbi:DUF6542 domain-containing protein [Mycobacterium kiyosense]
MSAQRERSAVEPSHRSIVPSIPGVPWWAAVLIAVGATALGYLLDAGHKDLTHTFALLYIAGCVAAVLAVRQAAVFTAVIQPPLILFCAVPGAYWLFHGGKVDKFKDLLINCGYPLIERFPLMLGTAGGVLLIGLLRWYFGKSSRTAPAADAVKDEERGKAATRTAARTPLLTGLAAKARTLLAGLTGEDADESDGADAPPAHARGRSARTTRAARRGSAQRPAARTRSRHARPDEASGSADERTRRTARRSAAPGPEIGDFDPAEPPRRTRRRRPDPDADLGAPPPREPRREPRTRRNPYERPYDRPEPRTSRFDPYETYDRPEPPARGDRRSRPERRAPEPYPPYEPRRRATPAGSGGANPTHHPISQVRYRGQPPRNDPRGEPLDEPRANGRRPRAARRPPAEWEYDN